MRVIDIARKRKNNKPFFVLQNGVTIRLKAGYPAGTTGQADGDVSGKVYTAVDNTMLFAMNPLTDDYTSVCTTLVTNISLLFNNTPFNQNISNWDTSNVTNMILVFKNPLFNQPIGFWDVSNVISFGGMFRDSIFNQPLNNWDVSNGQNFSQMFRDAINFNQDLSSWCVSQIPTEPTDFDTGATSWTQPKPNWGAPC